MKRMLMSLMLVTVLAPIGYAQDGALKSFTTWLGERPLHVGAMIDLDMNVSPIAYTDLIQWGDKGLATREKGAESYIDLGLGARVSNNGSHTGILVPIMFHPVTLSKKLYSRMPARERIKMTDLPDIAVGPTLNLPIPGINWDGWVASENIGFSFAWSF